MSLSIISRRSFLKAGSTIGLASMAPMAMSAHHANVGLQLYTARHEAEKDFYAVLENVASIGYKEIEFAGLFGHSAKDVRAKLDSLGLSSPSAHIPLTAFNDNLQAQIDNALALGQTFLVMPWLSPEQRSGGIKTYYALAETLNRIGEACRKHGLFLCYHNHDFEFEMQDNELPYDVLLKEVAPEHLLMELDLFWITKAGYSPLEYFNKHPGRFPLWHIKDMGLDGKFADVGTGTIDFASIFAERDKAGFKHGFVEHDSTQQLQKTLVTGFLNTEKLIAG